MYWTILILVLGNLAFYHIYVYIHCNNQANPQKLVTSGDSCAVPLLAQTCTQDRQPSPRT